MDSQDKGRGARRRRSASHEDDHGPAGHRHQRLERLLFEEISSLLRDDVRDPAAVGVRIVGAQLSLDYANVRLSYTVEAERRLAAQRALERVTGFLRGRLGDALDLKRVPQLRFVFDDRLGDEGGDAW